MKKIVVFFVMSGMFCVSMTTAVAQDTLTRPKSNYYYEYWLGDEYPEEDTLQVTSSITSGCAVGSLLHVNEPIEIQGVAIAIGTKVTSSMYWDEAGTNVVDTSSENCFEYFRLYKRVGDSLVVVEEAKCHVLENPVGQYLITKSSIGINDTLFTFYEAYFKSPVVVTDSVFVGMTMNIYGACIDADTNPTWPMFPLFIHHTYDFQYRNWVFLDNFCYDGSLGPINPFLLVKSMYYPLIFPIYIPRPDLIDTTAVEGVEASDGVTLSPNPAGEKVHIMSEQTILSIDVYAVEGKRVYHCDVKEDHADIDVSRWPRGEYVVNLTTSKGTVGKRLLVK